MIKIGSKVNVHFNLRMLRNLRILYLPRQTNDCWIFKNEKGEEIRVMNYDSIEELVDE